MSGNGLTIITCGDSNFFFALQILARNVEQMQGQDLVIYDLGLRPEERAALRRPVVSLDVGESFRDKTPEGHIRTHHKPAAIRHALETYGAPVLYIDADTLLTETLDTAALTGVDLVVTPRHPRERRKATSAVNGRINAGVMAFGTGPQARALLQRWAAGCVAGDRSDQRVLSDLVFPSEADVPPPRARLPLEREVDGARVRLLDPVLWNDVARRTGFIHHYKEIGRNSEKAYKRTQWETRAAHLATQPVRARLPIRLRRALYRLTGRA